MTVCETCGDKGYTQLLFHCLKCQIVAVHRYCMDGRPAIDDDEISWYCEECVPRVPKPSEPSRKCERVGKTIDREELRRSARKKWKNSLSLLESNKPDNAKDSDVKVTNGTCNLNPVSTKDGVPPSDHQENGVPPSDQQDNGVTPSDQQENGVLPGDQQENGVPSSDQQENRVPPSDQQENCNEKNTQHKEVLGDLKANASAISQRKDEASPSQHGPKCLNSLDDVENIRLIALALKSPEPCEKTTDFEKGRCKRAPLIQKKKDLLSGKIVRKMRTKTASSPGDVGDEQLKLENNEVLAVTNSIISKESKHEKSPDEVDSKLTGEVNDTSNSRATKHSDCADQEPEVVEGAIVGIHDHKDEDVQSSCTIRKSCSSRKKKRSSIIEMEYSDDDDTNNALTVLSPLKSSNDGEMFYTSISKPSVEVGSERHAPPIKVSDHNSTPAAPSNLAPCVPYPPCSSQIVDHVPSQPVIDVIWRGGCVITNNIDPTSFELEAHVSNKASPVVYGAAIALPKIIDFEIISKRHAWPKSFKKSPPTSEIIGLYFFPVGERDEVFYHNLLARMVDRQLMLMSQINNLELLVFSSHELPEEEWRFQRKYYLWGVFRSKQETTFPMKPLDQREVNYSLSWLPDMSRDDVYQKARDSNHRTDNLNHPKRASRSQTPDTRLDRGQPYGSHKRRYHHEMPPPKFRKHRAETDGYEYDDRETSYQSEVGRRNHRMFRTAHKDSYHRRGHYRHHRGH